MAKKKSSTPKRDSSPHPEKSVPAESPAARSKRNNDPAKALEAAARVAKRVQIRNILVAGCSASRGPNSDIAPSEHAYSAKVKDVRAGIDSNSNMIVVTIEFYFTNDPNGDIPVEAKVSITCRYVLMYSFDSSEPFSEGDVKAFGALNGAYNAWPYWREFVQSMTAKMGLPSITIPVFRIP
jgi:hypothetical protein